MASTLSERSKTKIRDSVNQLLGRARVAFPMPLTTEEIYHWWDLTFDDENIPKAYWLLEKANYSLYITSYNEQALFVGPGGNFRVSFKSQKLLTHPAGLRRDHTALADLLKRVWPFGPERWGQLSEWMATVSQIDAEFSIAASVSGWVIDKCNTPGQINRALPELANYLTGAAKEALHDQKRASNMPYEWAAFDKSLVHKASLALTKANLLPVVSSRAEWGTMSENWCTFESA